MKRRALLRLYHLTSRHQAESILAAGRIETTDMMQGAGLSTLNSESALRVKLLVNASVQSIIRRHPSFGRIWPRYFANDPFTPLDEMALQTGLLGDLQSVPSA